MKAIDAIAWAFVLGVIVAGIFCTATRTDSAAAPGFKAAAPAFKLMAEERLGK